MDKYAGKRLDGRYEIHELIGIGGMAIVYRAYDTVEDRIVAIKILKEEYLDNKDFIRRFKNESKAIAILRHPNIVKVYDVSFGDKIQYIVMEYIDGITLKEYINHQHNIKWQEAIHFTAQILKALEHAHAKGIVHRDIKPQNIILLKDGTIKVTDFGIARFSRNETRTMSAMAIGSVHYIAPEQVRGEITDEKADIYSVGVILYEMLTGSLPFEADNAVSVAIMQLQNQPKFPREINEDIPFGLEEITLKAMQKEPMNRYNSAAQMLDDIRRFLDNPSIHFNYEYFVDNNQTKYIDISSIKGPKPEKEYDDNYEYEDEVETKKKKKSMLIMGGIAIAVVIFALMVILGAIFKSCSVTSAKDVDVPDFIGMKLSDVQNNPEYKFNWNVENVYDSNQPEGVIIDQSPKSGTKKVKEGATITLKVNSSGTLISVPNVKGLTQEVATARIKEAGFECEVLGIYDNETAQGIVKNTDPQGGTKAVASTVIKVFVSKGAQENKVRVPDVINKTLAAAKEELVSQGLRISDKIITEKSDKPKDTVIATDPLPGVEVNEGTAVQVTISSGEATEKNLVIDVYLPSNIKEQVTLTVYVDGVYDSSKKVVPEYNNIYSLSVKGTSGTKKINVDLNGNQYRVYSADFDSLTVKTIAEYPFIESTSSGTGGSTI